METPWYSILLAARRITSRKAKSGDKTPLLTAQELSEEARLDATDVSTAQRIASAWLAKFVRWGYALRAEKGPSGGGRPVMLYRLTRWGEEFKPRKAAPKKISQPRRRAAANPEGDE